MTVATIKITDLEQSVLDELHIGFCLNRGVDGFYCAKATIDSLVKKELVFYGRFPTTGPCRESGWQLTEKGLALFSDDPSA